MRQFSIPRIILNSGVIGPIVALDRGWCLIDPALGNQPGVLFFDDLLHHLYPIDPVIDLLQLPTHLLLVIIEYIVGQQNEPSLLITRTPFLTLPISDTEQLQPQPLNIFMRLLPFLPLILQFPLDPLLLLI